MKGLKYWYLEALRRRGDAAGRSRRREYWTFFLVNGAIFIIAGVVYSLAAPITGTRDIMIVPTVILFIFALVLVVPAVTLSIRRLHDIGVSGWWLIFFLSGGGAIVLFIFSVMDSQPGINRYGANPKGM